LVCPDTLDLGALADPAIVRQSILMKHQVISAAVPLRTRIRLALERASPRFAKLATIAATGSYEIMPPRRTYAAPGLHRHIERLFPQRDGFFVEAGGFDGLFQSNTAYLERYRGWRGILIEPIPHKFVECLGNRPQAQVVHAGLVPIGDERPHVELIYGNAMTLTTDSIINATYQLNLANGCCHSDPHLHSQCFLAPARSLDSIFADYGYPTIDLFSLDVEGAEMSALLGIDFNRSRPLRFLIETGQLDAVGALMADKGYVMTERLSGHDYLFEAR